MELTGKSALITGASRGIGRAIALRYAESGANVALLARDSDSLEKVAAQAEDATEPRVKVITMPCDVTDADTPESAVTRCVSAFGQLDILVNNAGSLGSVGPFLELTDHDWQHVLAVDLLATIGFLRYFGRHATARGSGCVVNISSVAGGNGVPMMSHYAAVKAAMNSLTRSLAAEWASAGVRVNAIVPGWVATDLTAPFRDSADIASGLMRAVPGNRWGNPEDIADGALYLASDRAAMITGSCLTIDGGMTAYSGGPAMIDLLALGRIDAP